MLRPSEPLCACSSNNVQTRLGARFSQGLLPEPLFGNTWHWNSAKPSVHHPHPTHLLSPHPLNPLLLFSPLLAYLTLSHTLRNSSEVACDCRIMVFFQTSVINRLIITRLLRHLGILLASATWEPLFCY